MMFPRRSSVVELLEQRTLFATLPAGFTENLMGGAVTLGSAMAFAPDGRLFICQQSGAVRVIDHGALQATPFVSLTTGYSAGTERGLLGIAFDPDYFNNHWVYLYYTATSPTTHNRISRFTADPNNQNVAVAGSEFVLQDLPTLGATNHNGGAIHFGPDGKLYAGVGENAVGSNAQSFANVLGKMLRMNKDGSVPNDNPYFNDPNVTGQAKLIWSLGLRNPFTFAFQRTTGRMFINDVGQSSWEEIDDGIAHSNYGWPTIEGFRTTQTPPTDYRDPLFVYDHSAGQIAIIGGAFYNPYYNSYPATYVGKYFYGDLGAGYIRTLDFSGAPVASGFATGVSSLHGFELSPDGSMVYLQAGGTQGAYRVRFTDAVQPTYSSSFVFDEAKPTFGTAQRLRLSFSEYVSDSLTNTDVTIQNLTTGQTIATGNKSVEYNAATNVANISFPGFADSNGALPNGNYTATMTAASVTDLTGNQVTAPLNLSFFVLAGDANRDRHVDAQDQAILTANLGQSNRTFSQGDFNYDGTVNAADQAILDANWHYWLPPQGPTALPATGGDDTYTLKFGGASPALIDVFNTPTATGTPLYRVYSGAATSLTFGGGAGNDALVLDYSAGSPLPSGGITFTGDADNDTLAILGTSAADSAAITLSTVNLGAAPTANYSTVETVTYDGAGGTDSLMVQVGAKVTLPSQQRFSTLSLGGSLTSAPGAASGLGIITDSLTISGGGLLDLNDNDMIVNYSGGTQLPTIEGNIAAARNGGNWLGTSGITSSTARNNGATNTGLGAIESADYLAMYAPSTSFDGEPIDSTAVLIKYTYNGDANFSGTVTFDDYVKIDTGFNTGLTGWFNGDFNYSGSVTFDDYVLIDTAFNTQGAPLSRPGRRGGRTGLGALRSL